MSYKSKRTIFSVFFYFLDTLIDRGFKGIHGYCVVFVSAFLCSPVCLLLAAAVAMEMGADSYMLSMFCQTPDQS